MSNASEARKVVYELYQDLERFSLDDYKPFVDIDDSKLRIESFIRVAIETNGREVSPSIDGRFTFEDDQIEKLVDYTLDCDFAQEEESVELLGLDHPIVERLLDDCRHIPSDVLGTSVRYQCSVKGSA